MFILLCFQCILVILASCVKTEFPPKFEESSADTGFPPGHLKAFGHHRPPDGPLVEEKGFLHPSVFWEKYVRIHKPMVFRQAVANSPALTKWSDEYLVEEYGDLDLLLEIKRENRSTSPKRLNISTFIDIYKGDDVYAVTLIPDPMRKDVQVPCCLLCGTFRDFVHETNFWMSSGGTRSVIHYDADENLHCIMNGSKDFMMIDKPFQDFLPMVEKTRYTGSAYSYLDPDSVDLLQYPDVAKVQWTYATLYPGDCIYIPSTYLHQVRSYNRTISATMLFTSNVDKTYDERGCEKEDFSYTPLSDIDVHWTYKKGDRTIDMGYINLELLRKNVLEIFDEIGSDTMTLEHFVMFLEIVIGEEAEVPPKAAQKLYYAMFGMDGDGKITREDVEQLSREKLKLLARTVDDPHGPVREDTQGDSEDNVGRWMEDIRHGTEDHADHMTEDVKDNVDDPHDPVEENTDIPISPTKRDEL